MDGNLLQILLAGRASASGSDGKRQQRQQGHHRDGSPRAAHEAVHRDRDCQHENAGGDAPVIRHSPDRKPDHDVDDQKGAHKGHMNKTLVGALMRGEIVACCRRVFDRAVIGHRILQLERVRLPCTSERDLPQLSRERNGGDASAQPGRWWIPGAGRGPYEPVLWSSPPAASAAFWRSVTRAIEKSSIASLNSRWKLSSAPR